MKILKKKKVIAAGVVAVCLAIAGYLIIPNMVIAGSGDVTVSASAVNLGDLSNYISVTGTVESTDVTYIYAQVNEEVAAVHVKLGDVVREGQLLCELDPADIEQSILEHRATMSNSQQQSYNKIKDAERSYNDARANLANSTNSQVNSAENTMKNAETDLDSRQKTYDEKLAEYNSGAASKLQTAERNVSNAKRELDTRTKTYEENVELFAVDAISRADLDNSLKSLETAQESYDDALTALNDTNKTLADELQSAYDALVGAQTSYNNARQSLNTVNTSVEQDLVRYRDSVETARFDANNDSQVFQLEKLERQLEQTQIRATASGTVTAIYAKTGVAASGLLFVIEDTDSLKVTTSIKEYNLAKVEPGLPAKIESDATGSALYNGVLTMIAPTSKKDSSGNSVAASDVDFEAEVSVQGSELRIGSNARVDLIYEQREGVMYVPVESVARDMNGSYIYALIPQNGNGSVEVDISEFTPANRGESSVTGEMPAQVRSLSPGGGEMPARGECPPMSGNGETAVVRDMAAARAEMAATGGSGATVMRFASFDPDAFYTVTRINVTTGMETDLYIEVSGENLRPGTMAANNPGLVNEGDVVKIGLNNSGFRAPAGGRMGGPGGGTMAIPGGGGGGGAVMRIGG